MSRPTLSVVIPTYNGRTLLETCLKSLERHRPQDLEIEILVVDDASTDGTADWISCTFPYVRVVRMGCNGGFCASANAGIAAAQGTYIQLLNNDTEVMAGWVEVGLAPFADPTVGSVAPLVLVRSDPSRVDSAGDSYAFFGWPSKRGHGQPADRWLAHPGGEVFGASGSSAFYRTEAVRRVGAFDPGFGSYYEDVDLSFRLRWLGYRCVFAPDCRILHEISASYDHARLELQRRMSRNAELLFWSNLPFLWLLSAIVPHLLFIALQGSWRLLQGRARPFLQGKLEALRALRSITQGRKLRVDLARSPIARPHFPLRVSTFQEARDHLRRPRESFGRG